MQITLYRGEREFTADLDVDEETGEIAGAYPLDVLVKRNPIGTCAYILNTLANADMIDAHIKQMQAKKKAMQNNAERAKEALKQVMQITGTLSVKADDCTFSAVLAQGRDKSVEIFDEKQIPEAYMREIPAQYVPDKAGIMQAMKDGWDVPGCRIVAKDRLTIK